MTTREQYLNTALSKVGTGENPPGSNCQPFSKALGRPCEAWCADFVVATGREAGLRIGNESAYTPSLYNSFVAAGKAVTNLASGLEPGDIIFFDFVSPFNTRGIQHVGIFHSYAQAGYINTVEGNTSSGDSGSQDNGDGVYRRVRPLKYIVGAGRPNWVAAPPPPPGVHPEYDPPLAISVVSGVSAANGTGGWLLGPDGGVFTFGGAQFFGSPVGQDYWAGRHAKLIEAKDNGGYRIVSQENPPGTGYDYPGGGNIIASGPAFDPPVQLRIVADLGAPTGGVWILLEDGAIWTLGNAQYKGGTNGKDYFAGRKAARLEPSGDGYVIVATSGEKYGPVF